MLAQVDKVDPSFFHQFTLVILGLLSGLASAAAIAGALFAKRRKIEPQPLQVEEAEKFVTASACGSSHAHLIKRLDQHDEIIRDLWTTFRAENASIRHEMTKGFQDMERALGRIEGKLDRN
jgi:hypothetical protein